MASKLPAQFHRIWTASAVSSIGDGIYFAALPLLALTMTHNTVLLGTLEACAMLPWLCFGMLGGALVDRLDRRRTMVAADLCRFLLLALVTALVTAGAADLYLLFAAAFLLGIGQVFFDTASTALLPELLDRDLDTLQRANARLQGTQQAFGGFVGPPTGSLLFGLGRAVPIFGDALSFLVSSLTIWTLPKSAPKPPQPRGSLLREAREGAAYLFGNRLLVGLALRPALGNFAFMGANAVLVLFVKQTLHLGTSAYGIYLTAGAVGALGGSFVAAWLAARLGTGGTLTLTAMVEGVALLGIGLSPNAWIAGIGEIALGMGIGTTMGVGPAVRQAIVPDHLMGRVAATARLIALCAGPAGAVFGGWLAHVAGLRAPFILGAGILMSMTVVAARLTSNKRIEAALAEAAERREREAADALAASGQAADAPAASGQAADVLAMA
ncbi:MFS transporter [Catenulispora pinisilvae]|uniref:MFS transporter n=1 Tax=Catenulispora pinisilvae TaxID=2705253 RepID=UPI00189178D3|nr:MFS transporter [Catenulispora pinisilvae]